MERLMMGISAQAVAPHEIILVDSGSTDETVAIARAYDARMVHVDPAEFTFGRALNRGCAAATGDVCVFASGHVYPLCTTWLEELIEPFGDERVALSYGRQRGNETNKFSEHLLFAQWFPSESVCPQPTYFCNNANCAIRRSIWETHPYDETLTGLEDLAWAQAVRARGAWIAYKAEAEVIHVHDETWEQVQTRYRREAMALRTIDEHAHFTRGDFVRLLARNVVSDIRAASNQGVLRRELGSILRFRYNQLAGTYAGFHGPSELSVGLRARLYYPGEHGRLGHQRVAPENVIDYATLEAEAHRARLEGSADTGAAQATREGVRRGDGADHLLAPSAPL
jgi:glycosyltransferase involved in cell wall biosynthesis